MGPTRDYTLPPRIEPWHFGDEDFRELTQDAAEQYYAENLGTVDSAVTLWEAFKTVIRDRVQFQIGVIKKEKQARSVELETEIIHLEARIANQVQSSSDQRHLLRI